MRYYRVKRDNGYLVEIIMDGLNMMEVVAEDCIQARTMVASLGYEVVSIDDDWEVIWVK